MKPGNCCSRGVQKVARTLQDLLTIPTPQIVVAQHHNGRVCQLRPEDPLAATVERVAIDQGIDVVSHWRAQPGTGRCTRPRPGSPRLRARTAAGTGDWPTAE